MWDHLTSGELSRAKQEIERRRAEAVNRHEEETKILKARQAEEIQALDAKQAEIEQLDGLIESFTKEFNPQQSLSERGQRPDGSRGRGGERRIRPAGYRAQLISDLLGAAPAQARSPGPLQVRFPSPNFQTLRLTPPFRGPGSSGDPCLCEPAMYQPGA